MRVDYIKLLSKLSDKILAFFKLISKSCRWQVSEMSIGIFKILIFEISKFSISTIGREVGHVNCACLKFLFWSCSYLLLSLERNSPDSAAFRFPSCCSSLVIKIVWSDFSLCHSTQIVSKVPSFILISSETACFVWHLCNIWLSESSSLDLCSVAHKFGSLLSSSLWLVAFPPMVLSVKVGSAPWHFFTISFVPIWSAAAPWWACGRRSVVGHRPELWFWFFSSCVWSVLGRLSSLLRVGFLICKMGLDSFGCLVTLRMRRFWNFFFFTNIWL